MSRRSPYSAMDGKSVKVESIRKKYGSERLVVGVAKFELIACVYGSDRRFERPWRVKAPGEIRWLVQGCGELAEGREFVPARRDGVLGDVRRCVASNVGGRGDHCRVVPAGSLLKASGATLPAAMARWGGKKAGAEMAVLLGVALDARPRGETMMNRSVKKVR